MSLLQIATRAYVGHAAGLPEGSCSGEQGKTLPPETLSPDEVGSLFNAIKGDGPVSVRNRAMVGLMYRAEIKVGALVKIAVHYYDSDAGALAVPGSHGGPSQEIRLDLNQQEHAG
jgi:site-specific recombinase XerD